MRKSLIFHVILAALPVLALPITAQAQLQYTIADGQVTITNYTGSGGEVTIPESIDGDPVTAIGSNAFASSGVTGVTIPDGVTNISYGAFTLCFNLTTIGVSASNPSYASVSGVLFNKTVTTLVEYPEGRADSSYVIPNGVTTIGNYAFEESTLSAVTTPNSVTSIGDYAFDGCVNLTSVAIGDSVTNIGDEAFVYCEGLTTIGVSASNASYASVDGVLFDKTLATLIQYPASRVGSSYVIPDGVTTIGDSSFVRCSILTSVTIPDSVTVIGDDAFEQSSLSSVMMGNSVTTIGDSAFLNCYGLSSLTIPGSVTNIGSYAFQDDGLTTVTIPASVTSIGDYAFAPCGALTGINVIASNANYASVSGVLFNKTVTTLLEYPAGRAGSYVIPGSVTSIGDYAFYESALSALTIPNSVTSIGDYAFYDCFNLASVAIGDSVTNIGEGAYASCFSLTTIGVSASNPKYASISGVFFDKTLATLILYPGGRAGSYVIPGSVTNIGTGAFLSCYGLTSVKIPDSVTSIGDEAFAGSGLKSVTIPGSITNIGSAAFQGCTSLGQAVFQGNAPSVDGVAGSADGTVFSYDGAGKAYYAPGATDWGATFGGWPTALSYQPQPQILSSGAASAAESAGFQFTIAWATNTSVVVEASTDLQNWTPTSTNILVNGVSAFVDSNSANYPQRFYRLRAQQ